MALRVDSPSGAPGTTGRESPGAGRESPERVDREIGSYAMFDPQFAFGGAAR